jgi:hypothetical protein
MPRLHVPCEQNRRFKIIFSYVTRFGIDFDCCFSYGYFCGHILLMTPIFSSRDSFIFSPSCMVGGLTLQFWELQGFNGVRIHQIISRDLKWGSCNFLYMMPEDADYILPRVLTEHCYHTYCYSCCI